MYDKALLQFEMQKGFFVFQEYLCEYILAHISETGFGVTFFQEKQCSAAPLLHDKNF